jgi:hypothetical protein
MKIMFAGSTGPCTLGHTKTKREDRERTKKFVDG